MSENKEEIKYKIKAKHFFMFSKMFAKMGIKQGLQFNNYDMSTKDGQMKMGTELVDSIISNLYKVEEDSYFFLSDVTGWKIEKIREMDLDEYLETWQDLLKNNQMKVFFQKLIKSIGMRKWISSMKDTQK